MQQSASGNSQVAYGFDVDLLEDHAATIQVSGRGPDSKVHRTIAEVFHISPTPMSIWRFKDCRYIAVNDAWLQVTGYSREEILSRTALELRGLCRRDTLWVKQQIKAGVEVRNQEVSYRTKNCDNRIGLISWVPIYLNHELALLTSIIDITEHRRLEKEMSRLAQLNLIGEVAAGLGHEIRNPMTTVRGLLQLLSKRQENADLRDYFSLMIEELDRINSIITTFLTLAKNRRINLQELGLHFIVKALYPRMKATALPRDKRIELRLQPVPLLWLDKTEIDQLVLHLVQNALEATPSGGTVTVSTYSQGENVFLAVTDEGKGIPSEIIDQIGIPFFTTKECATGMGMAICYSIAARHKARIQVDTGPGGTTFYVQFPQQSGLAKAPKQRSVSKQNKHKQGLW